MFFDSIWEIDLSGMWDSNPQPRGYLAHTLTTELSSKTIKCA